MADIRIIKHEAVAEVRQLRGRFADGRPSQYFYWEDLPGRRLRSDLVASDVALEQAKAFARAERDR
jgi:hypothetical protein